MLVSNSTRTTDELVTDPGAFAQIVLSTIEPSPVWSLEPCAR